MSHSNIPVSRVSPPMRKRRIYPYPFLFRQRIHNPPSSAHFWKKPPPASGFLLCVQRITPVHILPNQMQQGMSFRFRWPHIQVLSPHLPCGFPVTHTMPLSVLPAGGTTFGHFQYSCPHYLLLCHISPDPWTPPASSTPWNIVLILHHL